MPVVPHIQSGSKTTFLNKHNRHATVELQRPTSQDTVSHMLIITYFQPNHPSVNISVNIDGVNKGFLQAAYCPSTIGCRGTSSNKISCLCIAYLLLRSISITRTFVTLGIRRKPTLTHITSSTIRIWSTVTLARVFLTIVV